MLTSMAIVNLICIILLSYLAGSVPTSVIVGKVFAQIDIRKHGSGNAGGTNSFRVLGWKAGVIVVFIDIFKGFAAAFWISRLNLFHTPLVSAQLAQIIAGASAIVGHCYTIFAGFRGGKGIATSAGMIIVLSPTLILILIAVFVSVLITTGYVSLSSISAAAAFPAALILSRIVFLKAVSTSLLVFSAAACLFIFYTHRSNIRRLISGKESRFDNLRIFVKK